MLRPPLRRKTNEFLTLPNEYDSTAGAPTGGFFMDTGNQSQIRMPPTRRSAASCISLNSAISITCVDDDRQDRRHRAVRGLREPESWGC